MRTRRLVNVRSHMMFRPGRIYSFDFSCQPNEEIIENRFLSSKKSLHKLLNELNIAIPHYSAHEICH